MNTNFEDIHEFHQRFKLWGPAHPVLLTDDLFQFRLKFQQEELGEFERAHSMGNLPKAIDALVDQVYVALGTAYLMGAPWQLIWALVHEANMRKIRADEANPSFRAQAFDVVKPDGWCGPDEAIAMILRTLGGRC